MTHRIASLVLVWLSLLGAESVVAQSKPAIVPADALVWKDAPSGARFAAVQGDPSQPGPFAFRMWMPAQFTMTPHQHNAAEHLTVVSGTLFMSFDALAEPTPLPVGSFVSIPADTPMWAWTRDEEAEIQIHGVGPFETTRVP